MARYKFKCPYCTKAFNMVGGFRRHLRYGHGKDLVEGDYVEFKSPDAKCPDCGRQCKNEWNLKNHIAKHHPVMEIVNKGTSEENVSNALNGNLSLPPEILRRKLIQVGKHFLDPNDIIGLKNAKDDLYIVKLRSEPNPEWPLWVRERDLGLILQHFELIEEHE